MDAYGFIAGMGYIIPAIGIIPPTIGGAYIVPIGDTIGG